MISALTQITNRLPLPAANMTSKTRWGMALLFPLVVGPIWCIAWSGHGGRLGTLTGLVLLGAIITSAITDFRHHRIYNWVTYSAFLWLIAVNIFAFAASYSSEPFLPSFAPAEIIGPHALGGVGLGESLAGAFACFLIVLFGYDLSGGGAGDVKIAAVIGAALGFHSGIFAIAYSYVVAALAIIAWSTYTNGPLALLKAGVRTIGKAFGPLWPFPASTDDTQLLLKPVALGPYYAIGTLLVLLQLVPTT